MLKILDFLWNLLGRGDEAGILGKLVEPFLRYYFLKGVVVGALGAAAILFLFSLLFSSRKSS